MPIPKPSKGEKQEDFISRFMADEVMQKEFPDQKQRVAVAYKEWRINSLSNSVIEKHDMVVNKTEIQNHAQFGKMFRGCHLEPGVVHYEGLENPITHEKGMTLYVDREAIAKLRETFVGKPVYNFMHPAEDVKPEDITQGKAVGVVIGNQGMADGWDWASFMVWDTEAEKNCTNGQFALSCSYVPEIDATPGIWHNIPYDGKVIGGEYEHLAIVPNPRYEGSQILRNSKGENKMSVKDTMKKLMMKFKIGGVENSVEINHDAKVKMGDSEVSVGDLIAAHTALDNSKTVEANLTDESVITLENGKTITVAELKAEYAEVQKKVVNSDDKIEAKPVTEPEKKTVAEPAKVANAAAKAEAQAALAKAAETRGDGNCENAMPVLQADRLEAGKRI